MIEIRERAQRPNTGFCEGYMIPVNPLTTKLPIAHYDNIILLPDIVKVGKASMIIIKVVKVWISQDL